MYSCGPLAPLSPLDIPPHPPKGAPPLPSPYLSAFRHTTIWLLFPFAKSKTRNLSRVDQAFHDLLLLLLPPAPTPGLWTVSKLQQDELTTA